MKFRNRKIFIIPLILIFILSTGTFAFADGDISVKNWNINSKIMDNGNLNIIEDITFYFNSDFNGVFKDININKTDGISDLQIEEIKPNNKPYKEVQNADNGDSDVYTIEESDENINIKIYSPSEYEEKTFRFSYTMLAVVNKYNDTSELYHKFIGDDNDSYIENLNIDIKLPKDKTDEVKIFGHGYRDSKIQFANNDSVNIRASKIESGNMIEARILMPVDFVSNMDTSIDDDMLDIILKQEESYLKDIAKGRTIKAKREKGVGIATLISIALGSILALYSYFKNKHNVEPYEEQLKGNMIYLPPAIITAITRMPFDANMLTTSLYNLSYKNFISIEDAGFFNKKYSKNDIENFKITDLKKDRNGLLEHEIFLLDWLFNDIARGNSFTAEDLYNYNRTNSSKFHKKFTDWCKIVSKDLITLELKDNTKVNLGIGTIIISLILLVLGIFNIIIYRNVLKGVILLVLFLLLLIFGIELTQRLTDLGHIQYTKLMDFKKDVMKGRLNITDKKLLIVAMALGIGMDKLSLFEETFITDTSSSNSWIYWYFLMNSHGQNVFAESISTSSGLGDIGSGGNFTSGGGAGSGGGGVGGF